MLKDGLKSTSNNILFDSVYGESYCLNETGQYLFDLLKEHDFDHCVKEFAKKYKLPQTEAYYALCDFKCQLMSFKLVTK